VNRRRYGTLVLAVVLIALLFVVWSQVPATRWIDEFRLWVISFGAIGAVAFSLIYIIVTVVLGPASGLTLMAGLAYGGWGFPLVIFSATSGAAIAFLLGRYVAHKKVSRWIADKPKMLALNQAVSDEGWRVVALMRLSPILPYGVQNYLFSVTHVGFWPFVVATLFSIMPATALYIYIGSLGQSIGKAGALQWAMVLVGLVVTATVAWFVGKKAREALAKQAGDSQTSEQTGNDL